MRRGWLREKRVTRVGPADVKIVLARTLEELGVHRQTRRPSLRHANFTFDIDKKTADHTIEENVIKHITDILGESPRILKVRGISSRMSAHKELTREVRVICILNPLNTEEGGSHEKA